MTPIQDRDARSKLLLGKIDRDEKLTRREEVEFLATVMDEFLVADRRKFNDFTPEQLRLVGKWLGARTRSANDYIVQRGSLVQPLFSVGVLMPAREF